MANEQELKKLLNTSVQKQLEGLAIVYWGETYNGKFLATVDFGDLPKFAEYAIKAMGYKSPEEVKELILDEHNQHADDVEWDREKVACVICGRRTRANCMLTLEDLACHWCKESLEQADQLKEILAEGEL